MCCYSLWFLALFLVELKMTDFWLIFFLEGLSSNSWKRLCVWMFVVVFSPKLFNKETFKKRVQHPLANQSEEEVLSNQKKWWVDTSVINTAQKQSPFCALAVNLFLLRFPWLFLLWCNWRTLQDPPLPSRLERGFGKCRILAWLHRNTLSQQPKGSTRSLLNDGKRSTVRYSSY